MAPSIGNLSIVCRGPSGQAIPGGTLRMRMVAAPDTAKGSAYQGAEITLTADNAGLVQVQVIQGATYEFLAGNAVSQQWRKYKMPTLAEIEIEDFVSR